MKTDWPPQDGSSFTPSDLARFWKKVNRKGPEECWEWTGGLIKGYGSFSIRDRTISAHKASFLIIGTIPKGAYILHSCDNPKCVNPAHLRVGDVIENAKDREARCPGGRGHLKKGAKLSTEQAMMAKDCPRERGAATRLARAFNVDLNVVLGIRDGLRWRHLSKLTQTCGRLQQ